MLFRMGAILSLYCLLLRLLLVPEPLKILHFSILVLEDWGKHSFSTWPNHKELRFWISIHLWYSLDNVVKLTNTSLDKFFEVSRDLPLIRTIIISSSILIVGYRFEYIELIWDVGICIFTMSLIGTTMQDGGTRKRSMWCMIYSKLLYLFFLILFW